MEVIQYKVYLGKQCIGQFDVRDEKLTAWKAAWSVVKDNPGAVVRLEWK
jgi:hypothetical protein